MPDRNTWYGRAWRRLAEGLTRLRAWRLRRRAALRARLAEEMRRMDLEEERLVQQLRELERDDGAARGAEPPGRR